MTRAELRASGFELEPDEHARLTKFLNLLLAENQTHNLTGVRTLADAWPLLVCDSLALLSLVQAFAPRRLLDLGSGGGIPGIPLACVRPELRFTLIDATRKKMDAARRIATGLELPNVSAVWGRAESLAHTTNLREQFDLVAAKAVARLPVLLECAAGFVRVGGRCCFFKSTAAEAEIQAATRSAAKCGLRFESTLEYTLPAGHGQRLIVIYTKTDPLRSNLPRAPGIPGKRPL